MARFGFLTVAAIAFVLTVFLQQGAFLYKLRVLITNTSSSEK